MTLRPLLHSLTIALAVAGSSLAAAPMGEFPILLVAADCSGAAAEAAARTGGRVLTVSSRNQDGRTVCVVTVLVPSGEGGRPRKQTVVVPQ